MAAKDRRQRYYHFDNEFKPTVGLNVNEYLIEHYDQMSLKFRRGVWITMQKDPGLDLSSLENLVDQYVQRIADQFPDPEATKSNDT